jgi:hypothetical protein
MIQPNKEKAKSLLDEFQSVTGNTPNVIPQSIELSDHTGATSTSASQYQKAVASGGSFDNVIQQKKQEEEAFREAQDAEQTRLEGLLEPQTETEAKLKEKLADDKKFINYKSRQEKLKKLGAKNTDLLDGNGVNLFAPAYWLHDALSDDKDAWGKTKVQEKEFKKLNQEQLRDVRPVLIDSAKEFAVTIPNKQKQLEELKQQHNALAIARVNTPFGGGSEEQEKDLAFKINRLQVSLRYDTENQKKVNDYLTGKNTIWDGLLNNSRDLKSVGIISTIEDLQTAVIARKVDEVGWDNLEEVEKEVLKSYNKKQETENLDLMKDRFWYRTGDGTGRSLVFMEGMIATGGIGSAVGNTAKGTVEQGTKQLLKAAINNTVESTLARRLTLGAARGAFKILPTTIAAATELGVASAISPMTYSGFANDQIGVTQLVKDENGEDKVLVRKSIEQAFKRDYETAKINLELREKVLLKKVNRSEAEEQELNDITANIDSLDNEFNSIRAKSVGESLLYGYTETAKEYASEKFVGAGFEKLSSKVGGYITKKLAGTKLGNGINYLSKINKEGSNLFNNSMVGKISAKAVQHTGVGQLWNGIPSEIMEEIATQVTPTVNQDYANQLKELTNPTFYADIAAQTILMGGAPIAMGSVKQLVNIRKNNKLMDEKESIRKTYRAIVGAISDDDLAQHIVMSTGGTGFSIAEYDNQIAKLKQNNKIAEADVMEQKKFYNLAVKAMQTNTLDEFQEALVTLKSNPNNTLNESTVANIALAEGKIETLRKTYTKYQDAPNLGEIISLASDKITNKQSIESLNSEIGVQALIAKEELEGSGLTKGIDFSMSTLFDKESIDPVEKVAYDSFLDKVNKAKLLAVESYANLLIAKSNLEFAQNNVMKAFNKVTSNTYLVDQERLAKYNKQINFLLQQRAEESGSSAITNQDIEIAFFNSDKSGISKEDIQKTKEKFLDFNGIGKIQRQLDEIDTVNNIYDTIEEVKQEAIISDSASMNYEEGEPTVQTQDVEPYDISENELQKSIRGEAEIILGNTLSDNSVEAKNDDSFADYDPDDYSTLPLSVDQFDDSKKQSTKQAIGKVFDILTKVKGHKPSFQELVYHMLNFIPEEQAESQFDAYKLGWSLNDYEVTNFNDVYNTIFDPAKKITEEALDTIRGLFTNIETETELNNPEDLAENTLQQEADIEIADAPIIIFSEENIPVKAIGGNRTLEVEGKLGYNAIAYEEIEDEEGVWKRQTAMTGQLNLDENSLIDFRPLLNPDKFLSGTTVNVRISPEGSWDKIKSVVGRDEHGKAIVKTFSEIVSEKEKVDPNFKQTAEFNNIVPIFVFEGNTPVAYIHDINWYNAFNVADPTKGNGTVDTNNITPSHYKLIQEGKTNVSVLRNQIIKGNLRELTINDKKEGAFYTIANRTDSEGNLIPLMTINEANPQAEIAIQVNQGDLEQGTRRTFESRGNRKIINKKDIIASGGAGHTWNLRRIGTDPIDGKETWRAFKVVRYVNEKQFETVRWAWAAYGRVNEDTYTKEGVTSNPARDIYAKNVKGTKYEVTEEQANKIIADIKRLTGYNLKNWKDVQGFMKLYMQPKNGDALSNYGKTLYAQEITQFSQHTLNEGLLRNGGMVEIDNGIVQDLGVNYSEYLKNNLMTDIKSFNIGTEEKPNYVTSVQPTITFTYDTNQVEESVPQERAEIIAEAMEIAREEVGITQDAETILSDFYKLRDELGFTNTNFSQSPVPMVGIENLKNIFNITQGLTIAQEGHIVKFVYNFISSAIDIKYKSKISTAKLVEELGRTYNSIVAPSQKSVEAFAAKLNNLNIQDERVASAIEEANSMLNIFNNIKDNWTAKDVKATVEAKGEVYKGQLGVLDKAMLEVSKTSDIKEESKINDDEDQNEQDNSERTSSFDDDSSLTENGKQKTTYRLRRFMAGIEKLNDDFSTKKGFLGLPEYVGFNEVFDTLYQLLGTGVYIESDYATMSSKILSMDVAYPWVKQFIDKLNSADLQVKNEFVTNYRKHALSMKFAMYTTGTTGTTLQVYDTNANEIKRVIIATWNNNFKLSPLANTDNSINKDVANQLLDQYESWGTDKGNVSDVEVRTWLSNFGIDLSDKYFKELKDVGFYNKKLIPYDLMFSGSNTPIGLLHSYLKKIVKKDTTNFEEIKTDHPFGDMNNVLKALSTGEARFTPKTMSKSFRDAGKNVSGVTVPNYLTNRVDDLKRSALTDGKLIDDLGSLSISQDSLIIDLLRNDPEFANKFGVEYLGLTAFKEYGKKSNTFSGIRDLNDIDHDVVKLTGIQDIQQETLVHKKNGFSMRIGRMFMPTMSDKKQMVMLSTGIFNFMSESTEAFNKTNSAISFTDELRELLYNQLALPELKRIINFHNNIKKTNIVGYDLAAQIFNFIPALNNIKDEKGIRLIKHIAVGEKATLENVETIFKTSIMDVIEEVAHNLTKEKMDLWRPTFTTTNSKGEVTALPLFDSKYVNTGKGSLEDKFQIGTYDYILNYMINNANAFTLLAGDPALYSQNKLFKNEPVPFDVEDDNFFINASKKMGTNIGKRLALMIAPGVTVANSANQEYLQIFLRDDTAEDKDIASNSDYLIKLYYGQEGLDKAQPILDKYYEDKTAGNVAGFISERNKLKAMFPSIEDYFDIDATDAQEYTTLHEHLIILESLGRISKEQSEIISDKLLKNQNLTKEELGLVFQPIKPVVTSQIIDKTQDVSRVIYIKSSSFPLIPQLTAGTKLDALRVRMEEMEGQYGTSVRASYQTANKVGGLTNTVDPYNSVSLANADKSMLRLSRNDFRIQQDVPYKSDSKAEKVSMGTQIFKLLMGDGMMNLEGFNVDGKEMNGQELSQYYSDSFEKLVNIKKVNLFRELGLSDTGNITDEAKFITNLQSLLEKEAIKRDYPIQDIKGLELDTLYDIKGQPYYEFKVPLWLSTNSNRYESLLNSIVTNRLMKHKIPGSAFVVGSETGFGFQESLVGIDQSRIIYLDGWNGKELKGVSDSEGNFTKAQVFVPSKFKISDKVLIDMFEKKNGEYTYIEKRENGTWRLKDGMIAPELLNQFSFRTPTSSHVSGSTIEIAGFLPPEVGDLMIVPKNFTKQKGLDYDVDKETTYQMNYVVDHKTGKISVLTDAHKQQATKKLRELLAGEDAMFSSELGLPAMGVFDELLRLSFDDEFISELQDSGADYSNKLAMIESKFDEKLMENAFIKSNLAVYNNSNPEVQKKINKVLSMKFAEDQADYIEGLNEDARKDLIAKEMLSNGDTAVVASAGATTANNSFTILSDEYQKQKMALGSAGKMAIGIYSNYVTFHGLTQQVNKPLRLLEVTEDGVIPKTIQIGRITSDGYIGKETTLDGKRSIAEAFAEKQNTATDNEKAQILGRVNINKNTIGVDSLLTLLGFDQDENGNSIPYMFLSQPILKEFTKRLDAGRGITSDFSKNLEEDTIIDLVKQYTKGGYIINKTGNSYEFTDKDGQLLEIDSELTGQAFIDGIKYNGQDGKIQIAVLQKFLDLNVYAKNMGKVQSLLNTNNLGKSIIESNITYENLKTFADNKIVSNVSELIGSFIPISEGVTKPEGYNVVGDYYIKPTTPQGQIVVNGLVTGQSLWGQFFPYNDKFFNEAVNETLLVTNVDTTSDYKTIESKQEIIQEAKKYIYSWRGLGVFGDMASTERERLFIDRSNKFSLASYLNNLQENSLIKDNRLLSKFTYELQTDGTPSLIKFNNTVSDNFDEEYLYNSLAEMIIEDRTLPEWNGEEMSTRKLAQELITYAYVEGGVQEAIQFIKYVPVEYLSEVGVPLNGRFVSANEMLQRISVGRNPMVFRDVLGIKDLRGINSSKTHTFVKQFIQHNPERATRYSDDKKFNFLDSTRNSFILNDDAKPKFIVTKGANPKSKLKQDKYVLYENIGANQFQRVSILGTSGMNEYEFGNTNASSILGVKVESVKTVNPDNNSTLTATTESSFIKQGETVEQIISKIKNMKFKDYKHLSAVADAILPLLDVNTTVTVEDTKQRIGGAGARGLYFTKENEIVIDSNMLKGEESTARVFIHEAVHSITNRELKKYYDADGLILSEDAPLYVKSLHSVWEAFKQALPIDTLARVQENKNNFKNKLPHTLTTEDLDMAYGAMNIFEFMSVAMESPVFQTEMSKQPFNETQSIWEKFKEVVIKILSSLNPEITKGSIAEASLSEILNFITEESKLKKESATFDIPEIRKDSQLEREIMKRDLAEEEYYNSLKNEPSMDTPDENSISLSPSSRLPEIKNCK